MKRTEFIKIAFIMLTPLLFIYCSKDKVLPITDFYVQAQGNLVGGKVNFFDNSKNQPTSWEWLFPGGTPSKSTLKDPVVVYTTPGKYSVTLTSTNADGSNTVLKNDYITIFQFNTFTDSRDGITYKSMMIGNDEWMIENLNFDTHPILFENGPSIASDSWCYEGNSTNCAKYGRL